MADKTVAHRIRVAVNSGRRLAHNEARLLVDLLEAVERWRELPNRWSDMLAGIAVLSAIRDIERCAEAIAAIAEPPAAAAEPPIDPPVVHCGGDGCGRWMLTANHIEPMSGWTVTDGVWRCPDCSEKPAP